MASQDKHPNFVFSSITFIEYCSNRRHFFSIIIYFFLQLLQFIINNIYQSLTLASPKFLLMDSQSLSWLHLFSLLLILKTLVLIQIPRCSSNPDELFRSCGATFSCGAITGVGYPFRGNGDPEYCGYPDFLLKCNQDNTTTIRIMDVTYRVLKLDQTTQTMKIAREDVMEATCPQDLVNTTLNYALFDYNYNYMNVTFLYGCPASINLPASSFLPCGSNGYHSVYVLPGAQGPGNCSASIVVPVVRTGSGGSVNITDLDQVIQEGFEVRWKVDKKACNDCTGSGGRCGYNLSTNQTTCFCTKDTCSAANRASGT